MNTTTNLPIAPSQQMALRISGTKQRQAGFAPLVSVGVLAGNEGANMDRATTVPEKPVYVIKHASDYILYQVIDRRVKSFDADASGVLSIALTIPSQFQLSDDQSPYTLLKKVYEMFVSEFMRPNNDGRDCFLNTDIDSEVFRSILQKYSLEARKTKYVTMNPTGLTATLRLSEDKMADFFRDSQYEELAQFKDVEIGEKCQSFPELDNLEIPRPIKYDVYVNDTFTHTSLSKPTNSYTTQVKDTDCYTYENVSFTLKQLFATPGGCIAIGNSKVQLDQARCRIDCTIGKQELKYNCVIKVSPNNVAAQIEDALKSQKIKILIDHIDITSYGDYNNLQIPATQILSESLSLSTDKYEDFHLKIAKNKENQHKIILTIMAIQQQSKPSTLSTNGHNGNGMRQGEIQFPPAVSEEKRIAKEKEQERSKRERRKALCIVVFAVGLLLGAGVGYVIGHYTVSNHQEAPSAKDKDPDNKNSGNQETPKQREEKVNKWLSSSEVVKAALRYIVNNPNEEDSVMLIDILNFESSKERLRNCWKEVKAEEEIKRQAELQREEQETAGAIKANARKEILKLVNEGNLPGCRNHHGWNNCLTKKERGAIEAILDMNKYRGAKLMRVQEYLENKKFNNYKSIIAAQEKIWGIISRN